jgi:ElaB/YqjD/DUF883 family membrane-anchored ribosome-binding protein
MEELIHKIVGSTGITAEQAKKSIEIVSAELKAKFPSILHSEIDNVVNGAKFGESYREKAENLREKIEEVAKEAGQKAETVFSDIRERMNELFHTNKNTGSGKQ